mgnify:CR=1 FL=1
MWNDHIFWLTREKCTNFPPGSRESVGGLSQSHYPSKSPRCISSFSRREGRLREFLFCISTLTSSWARPTLVREGIPSEENPGTFLFYPPSRGNPELLPLFLPLIRVCEFPGRERERDVRGANSVDRLSFTSQLRIYPIFGSSTQTHLPVTRVGASPIPRKGAR